MSAPQVLAPASELESIRAVAPAAATWLRAGWEGALATVEPRLLDLVQRRMAVGHGLALETDGGPAGREGADPLDEAVAAFTDGFVRHVATRRPELVAVLRERLGRRGTRGLVDALYVFDQNARLVIGHGRLFDPGEFGDAAPAAAPAEPKSLAAANFLLHDAALELGALDPVTTELVRLRAGSYHDCRTCLSMRLVVDGRVVVDDALFARLEHYGADPAFSPARRAALRYADAHMTGPHQITEDLRTELRTHFSTAQLVELSLDVAAWNYQKTLVALDLDAPASKDGLTGMIINPDGTVQVAPLG
ncbi:carboxymuconolactone decarboxylase family protein [Frankia sp. CNm7]|uniref:Carboxymuconolactone decarboxylase family protein n=1 Tax=Frankia nepalensis TaxID=1836974 RepID=A0A937RLG4_9ACTN|nr:carboxymuconolactone decarboxylase family protein [Frankia nepalensis]MBL7497632.1 carboxymuconolactone decarboxylase family protein [Frankia nepalensis]MBL7510054.1 carboxymuconolactone decarboxylase family protein [Frankia nepalensis]MBL7517536.1 carboxymuconolactone decarboxylase family protein [Frankia nepalensis]MBL7631075.1 carboxymuconolactone decarboxylase family protein [Frankia nepalensis]